MKVNPKPSSSVDTPSVPTPHLSAAGIPAPATTENEDYTTRLLALESVWWKKLLNVQAPYRWNIRRLKLGRVLEIGCGVGRLFPAHAAGSVGVDHNASSIREARKRGYQAYTVDEFRQQQECGEGTFDSLLFAHVFEHMTRDEALNLIREYLPYLKKGGRLVSITPQEAGYRYDASHVTFQRFEELRSLALELGLQPELQFSFPFPRIIGKIFLFNEFVFTARW